MGMVQELVTKDDLNGEVGAETIPFGFEGFSYEIDLADANATRFRDLMAEFIAVARMVTPGESRPVRRRHEPAYDFDPIEVRAWWKENEGVYDKPWRRKGKVPGPVVDAWRAAKGEGA